MAVLIWKEGCIMEYVLYKDYTKKFISYTETGKVIHVCNLEDAWKFETPSQARSARRKATKKMNYFCVYSVLENGTLEKVTKGNRNFITSERMDVYRKTGGHCYICGDYVGFNYFEVEHKQPISKSGTNDFGNLFPSCHTCNTMKHDLLYDDFMEKITKIFLFQMEKKHHGKLKWKIVHKLLEKMV